MKYWKRCSAFQKKKQKMKKETTMQISKYNRLIIFLFKLFSCMLLNLKGQRPNNFCLYFWARHNEKKETQTISDSPRVEASSKDSCGYTKTRWVMTHLTTGYNTFWIIFLLSGFSQSSLHAVCERMQPDLVVWAGHREPCPPIWEFGIWLLDDDVGYCCVIDGLLALM